MKKLLLVLLFACMIFVNSSIGLSNFEWLAPREDIEAQDIVIMEGRATNPFINDDIFVCYYSATSPIYVSLPMNRGAQGFRFIEINLEPYFQPGEVIYYYAQMGESLFWGEGTITKL